MKGGPLHLRLDAAWTQVLMRMASLGSQLLGRSLIGPRITWKPARAKRGSVPKYALSSPVRSDPTLGYASTAGAPFSPAYSALPPESARLQCLVPAILAHSDAGNHPNVLFVDTRRSAGTIYAGQFMAWGHSNSTNGLAILECKQPGSVGTGSQPSHRCPARVLSISMWRPNSLEGPCPDGPDSPRSKG